MEPFKNVFSAEFVNRLAAAIAARDRAFKQKVFLNVVLDRQWNDRELKDRMHHIAAQLHATMGGRYPRQLRVLMKIAPSFNGLPALVFPDYVEMHGLDHWELSIAALEAFTPLSSSEFAVRPFIMRDATRMMAQMSRWAEHENEHVRRLASEGCRPRLPWGMALPQFKRDPSPVLPILEKLRDDPSEYVRRSVANNLNDIAKDHPDMVLDIARRWMNENPARRRLVKHACRTLLKRGDATVMKLFGFHQAVDAAVTDLTMVKKRIPIGGAIEFSFQVKVPDGSAPILRIEYAIDYLKARGSYGRKVFKITERSFSGTQKVTRRHNVQDLTTRVHQPGCHHLHIIVNGRKTNTTTFHLMK